MDTGNDEDVVACSSLKRLKTCDENKDFISELPDSILVHILSFLPLEDAIKTVLLRRFGHLWCSIPVLDFNSCLYHECEGDEYDPYFDNEKFLGVIRHVLKLHNCGTLDKLCLRFGFVFTESRGEEFADLLDPSKNYSEKENEIADQIEKLISYAISRNVKVLDLNLRGCDWLVPGTRHKLPDVFSSKYLTDLQLTAWDLGSLQKINLKLLRSLLLREVSLSDEVMEKILLCCSLLEDLSLINCHGLSKLNCKNPNTKKVMLILSTEDGPLIISCPFVLSLKIAGWIEQAYLLDVSSLADVSINFSYLFKCEQKRYANIRRLLQNCRSKTFTICRWSVLVLSVWTLTNVPCPSFGWKNLILQLGLTKWHQLGLSLLLRSSLSVESLTMYIYAGWEFMFTTDEGKWIQEHDFDEDYYWDTQEATFPNLEIIQMYDYVNESYMIEMVKFLLKSATRLKKMVISTKKTVEPNSQNLFRISQELLLLPRASSEAVIYFS